MTSPQMSQSYDAEVDEILCILRNILTVGSVAGAAVQDNASIGSSSRLGAHDQHRTGSVPDDFLATLPSSARGTPERPWLAMTMRSAGHSFAFWIIVGPGIPVCTNSCVEDGSERRSRKPLSNLLLSCSARPYSAAGSLTLMRPISPPRERPR